MKKLFYGLMTVLLLFSLAACGQTSEEPASSAQTSVPKAETSSENQNIVAPTETIPAGTTDQSTESAADEEDGMLDLTALNSTMVYAEVYHMLSAPEEYVGRQIKMSGTLRTGKLYNPDGDTLADTILYACVIADATACCAQGIPFVLSDETAYPEVGTEVTVVGTFEIGEQSGFQYCRLVNATLAS